MDLWINGLLERAKAQTLEMRRDPKPEGRDPREGRSPKAETRTGRGLWFELL
jgi:hypothetical protein